MNYKKLIDRVRELDSKALPGPWHADHHTRKDPSYIETDAGEDEEGYRIEGKLIGLVFTGKFGKVFETNTLDGVLLQRENAEFIAEARTLLPQLADALERYLKLEDFLREKAEQWVKYAPNDRDDMRYAGMTVLDNLVVAEESLCTLCGGVSSEEVCPTCDKFGPPPPEFENR